MTMRWCHVYARKLNGTSDSMRLLSWLGCDEIVILVGMFDAFGAGDEDDDDHSVLADLNEPLHIRCLQ
jgi:hypothetical protein